jgi:hypothetical protein
MRVEGVRGWVTLWPAKRRVRVRVSSGVKGVGSCMKPLVSPRVHGRVDGWEGGRVVGVGLRLGLACVIGSDGGRQILGGQG